jgi:phage shock protein A
MATEKAQMDLDISHAESDRKIAALVAKLRAQRMNLEQTKDGLGDITSEISELQTIFHELSQQMFSGDAQYSSAHASQRVYDLGDTGGEGSSQGSRRSAAGTVEGEDCSKLYMANVRIRKLEAELVLSHERCGRIAGLEDEMEAYTTMQDEKIREMQDQIRDLHSKLDAERQRNEQLAHKFSASEAMNRTPSLTGYLPVHPGDREDRMKERHAEPPIPLTRQSVSELASKFESKTTDRELTSSPRSRALLQTSATVMSGPEPLIQRVMNLYDSKGTTLYDSKGRTLHDVKSNQIQIDTFMKAPSSPAPQGDNDVYIMSTASSSYSGNAASLSQFGSALLPEHSRLQEEKNRSYNPTYSQNDCHHGYSSFNLLHSRFYILKLFDRGMQWMTS